MRGVESSPSLREALSSSEFLQIVTCQQLVLSTQAGKRIGQLAFLKQFISKDSVGAHLSHHTHDSAHDFLVALAFSGVVRSVQFLVYLGEPSMDLLQAMSSSHI